MSAREGKNIGYDDQKGKTVEEGHKSKRKLDNSDSLFWFIHFNILLL